MKPLLLLLGAILVAAGLSAFILSYSSITSGSPPGKGFFAPGVGLAMLLGLLLVSYSLLGEEKTESSGSSREGEESWLSIVCDRRLEEQLSVRPYSSVSSSRVSGASLVEVLA